MTHHICLCESSSVAHQRAAHQTADNNVHTISLTKLFRTFPRTPKNFPEPVRSPRMFKYKNWHLFTIFRV